MNTNVTMIPVAQLHPHPDIPRKDLGDITELTASIKANGVLQNLTVVPRANPDVNYEELCRQYYADPTEENRTKLNQFRNTDGYTVIIGHRRQAAAKAAAAENAAKAATTVEVKELSFDELLATKVPEIKVVDMGVKYKGYNPESQTFVTIGERIHCIAPSVRKAMDERDPEPNLKHAAAQIAAGSTNQNVKL